MTAATPATDRVVICVFDGLRPDFVTPELMPNLARFSTQGTWFREARSVFPSMTRVATTSIATGAPPNVHGVVGNAFLFPQASRDHVLDMSRADDIALAETATGGRLVGVETFGDVLARAGKRLAVVHTGTAGSAYLINPRVRANGHWTFSILGRDHTQTPEAVDEVVARFGPLPPRTLPRFEETDYAEQVFREHVLAQLKPDVALIWFNEPDTSFHYRFLGSPETLDVLKAVDAAFGRILAWIDAQPDAAGYTVIAASDHGQISMNETLPLSDLLKEQGHAGRRAAERTLAGASFAMTGGNMGEIRILEGGTARRDAIAEWLQEQDFLGLLFSAARNDVEGVVPGSLSLSLVDLDHDRAAGSRLRPALRGDERRLWQSWPRPDDAGRRAARGRHAWRAQSLRAQYGDAGAGRALRGRHARRSSGRHHRYRSDDPRRPWARPGSDDDGPVLGAADRSPCRSAPFRDGRAQFPASADPRGPRAIPHHSWRPPRLRTAVFLWKRAVIPGRGAAASPEMLSRVTIAAFCSRGDAARRASDRTSRSLPVRQRATLVGAFEADCRMRSSTIPDARPSPSPAAFTRTS